MDPGTATLIAAAIAAVGSIAAAYVQTRKRKAAEKGLDSISVDPSRYQYKVRSVRNSARILNMDGDTIIEREMRGIRLQRGAQLLGGIHGATIISGEYKKTPDLTHYSDVGKAVSFKITEPPTPQKPNVCKWFVEVIGGLAKDDAPLDLTITTEGLKTFAMTRDEVRARYKNDEFGFEYFALTVDVPVDEMELQVQFPEGFSAETYAAVFYPRTENMIPKETNRIKSMIVRTPSGARLVIEKPRIPFRYAVYWMPSRSA